jgi:hypothetical protein
MDANGAEKLNWQSSIADLMIESWADGTWVTDAHNFYGVKSTGRVQ